MIVKYLFVNFFVQTKTIRIELKRNFVHVCSNGNFSRSSSSYGDIVIYLNEVNEHQGSRYQCALDFKMANITTASV